MTLRIGLACEDRRHHEVVTELVDKVLVEETWVEPELLDYARVIQGTGDSPYLELKGKRIEGSIRDTLRRSSDPVLRTVKLHGFVGGEPAKREAALFRATLLAFWAEPEVPAVVIVARDEDRVPEKHEGFEQVRAHYAWPFQALLAFPTPEIEGWLVCAFQPQDEGEASRLRALTQALAFNPVTSPERLTPKRQRDPTDAKRVLDTLTDEDEERAMRGMQRSSAELQRCGDTNGLARFIDDLRETLPSCL